MLPSAVHSNIYFFIGVPKTFSTCCVSLALEGTEESFLWKKRDITLRTLWPLNAWAVHGTWFCSSSEMEDSKSWYLVDTAKHYLYGSMHQSKSKVRYSERKGAQLKAFILWHNCLEGTDKGLFFLSLQTVNHTATTALTSHRDPSAPLDVHRNKPHCKF